nr:hypothetical protein [Capillimicrobium parvum]
MILVFVGVKFLLTDVVHIPPVRPAGSSRAASPPKARRVGDGLGEVARDDIPREDLGA